MLARYLSAELGLCVVTFVVVGSLVRRGLIESPSDIYLWLGIGLSIPLSIRALTLLLGIANPSKFGRTATGMTCLAIAMVSLVPYGVALAAKNVVLQGAWIAVALVALLLGMRAELRAVRRSRSEFIDDVFG